MFGTLENRDTELRRLGQSLSRLAARLDSESVESGWGFAFRTLETVSTGLSEQIGRRTAVARMLRTVDGPKLLRLLYDNHRIQANKLREAIGERSQSNLVSKLKLLIENEHIDVVEGRGNSRYYVLTPHGRRAIGAVLELVPRVGENVSRIAATRQPRTPIYRSQLRNETKRSENQLQLAATK